MHCFVKDGYDMVAVRWMRRFKKAARRKHWVQPYFNESSELAVFCSQGPRIE
jgi:hypothetical protein